MLISSKYTYSPTLSSIHSFKYLLFSNRTSFKSGNLLIYRNIYHFNKKITEHFFKQSVVISQ